MRTQQALVVALLLLLAGCASTGTRQSTLPAGPAHPPAGAPVWWQVKIQMGFETGRPVAWHVDALLADQLFGPVLERYRAAIPLWRFHRRAVNDASGHQMSFLFYADPAIATRVMNALDAAALLQDLRDAGIVRELLLPASGESKGPALEATSDADWPVAIQRTWPRFIMGVSDHWLALVAEVRSERNLPPQRPVQGLLDAYRDIDREVSRLWRIQGQSAYLHHLNALFGYQPLVLREKRLARF